MKLAVASTDGVSIAEHFGRSKYFLVFEIDHDRVLSVDSRTGAFRANNPRCCEVKDADGNSVRPDYSDMVDALAGCQAVLCRGMGWQAAEALVRGGINPLVIQGELSPHEAVQQYIDGKLIPATGFCRNTGRPDK
jgi:predicted Fe-Mo cluster-binding NifX family protein